MRLFGLELQVFNNKLNKKSLSLAGEAFTYSKSKYLETLYQTESR